jgi:hypothetical protein
MKVKSLSFNRSSGRDGAVKTAIKLKQHPTLCPLTRQNRPLFEVPINPFDMMFEHIYYFSMVPHISDMVDQTIGVLQDPLSLATKPTPKEKIEVKVQRGYAFVAMPMDSENHALVDVLEAIKTGASECGIVAERIDDDERSERITDRVLESIRKAEFVIVDLSNERPNVLFEAGYAHGMGKLPIYIAREGTEIHFDVKDYPVIYFRNMKELREKLVRRLRAIAEKSGTKH